MANLIRLRKTHLSGLDHTASLLPTPYSLLPTPYSLKPRTRYSSLNPSRHKLFDNKLDTLGIAMVATNPGC
ncbi:hypothetical protein [Moorena sp. SIO3I6]|uniref:hypothetical protein n=1 Tax=Moorena sp. SIO3I6 TaxID=2607831 RepID=UPI0025F0F32E|nr:hypothetical protein [Moorena sp. SIO3I6]